MMVELRDTLCQGLDIDNDEEIESTNLTSFIQLCESTQKRIVQSKEPVSWKEIEELLGTIKKIDTRCNVRRSQMDDRER